MAAMKTVRASLSKIVKTAPMRLVNANARINAKPDVMTTAHVNVRLNARMVATRTVRAKEPKTA